MLGNSHMNQAMTALIADVRLEKSAPIRWQSLRPRPFLQRSSRGSSLCGCGAVTAGVFLQQTRRCRVRTCAERFGGETDALREDIRKLQIQLELSNRRGLEAEKGKQELVQTVGSALAQRQRAQDELEKERSESGDLRLCVSKLEGELASAEQQLRSIRLEASSEAIASARQRMMDLESQVAKSDAHRRSAERDRDSSRLQALDARQAAEDTTAALAGLQAAMEEACTRKDAQIASLETQVVAEATAARGAQEKLAALGDEIDAVRGQLDAAVAKLEQEKVKWKEERENFQQELSNERQQKRRIESEIQQVKLKLLDTTQELEASKKASVLGGSKDFDQRDPKKPPAQAPFPATQQLSEEREEEEEAEKEEAEHEEEEVEEGEEASTAASTASSVPSAAEFNERADERARLRAELAEIKQMLAEAGYSNQEVKADEGVSQLNEAIRRVDADGMVSYKAWAKKSGIRLPETKKESYTAYRRTKTQRKKGMLTYAHNSNSQRGKTSSAMKAEQKKLKAAKRKQLKAMKRRRQAGSDGPVPELEKIDESETITD